VVFPSRCAGCGRHAAALCDACAIRLAPAPHAAPPPPIAWWTACFAYEGAIRELIARAKYRDERDAMRRVVPVLASAVTRAPTGVDVVTWVPASRARLAARGVDHGEVLARAVARALCRPAVSLLRRTPGPAQTGRDARARRAGPALHARRDVHGLTVLIVDDVATTGGSLAAGARALSTRGASVVYAATVARTPRPHGFSGTTAYTPSTQFR